MNNDTVVDAIKLRIDSKSFSTFANDPIGLGIADILRSITFSKIIEDIIISAFFPATSSKYVRRNLNPKSINWCCNHKKIYY